MGQMGFVPYPRGFPLTPEALLSPRVFSSEQKGLDWGWGSAGKGVQSSWVRYLSGALPRPGTVPSGLGPQAPPEDPLLPSAPSPPTFGEVGEGTMNPQ